MAELIVALDLFDRDELLGCAKTLAGTLGWCKIGLQAFVANGPMLVNELVAMGYKVFLDLKYYDIPNTVAQAVHSAARLKVGMLTVHTQGGEAMCRAAMKAAGEHQGERPLIFGVTALTSFSRGGMPGITADPGNFARELASLADTWGLDGVVCSGSEAREIRARTKLGILCPGIRPKGLPTDDQARVVTPALAVRNGADYLVVGRPITRATDPVTAARAILEEMRQPG